MFYPLQLTYGQARNGPVVHRCVFSIKTACRLGKPKFGAFSIGNFFHYVLSVNHHTTYVYIV